MKCTKKVSQKQNAYYEKYKLVSVQFLTLEWIKYPARKEGKITVGWLAI